jgi:hypothetical protein
LLPRRRLRNIPLPQRTRIRLLLLLRTPRRPLREITRENRLGRV